jgi:chromosome transmission fidelity protein 1
MSDYTTQLFSHLSKERLSTFSCGHIIPAKNITALVVGKSPRGTELEFKFSNRNNSELVRSVLKLATWVSNHNIHFRRSMNWVGFYSTSPG